MPTPKQRLDLLLVARGLAESRAQAQALIMAGHVLVGGQPATKPGMAISTEAAVALKATLPYASRGGLKLAHALGIQGTPRVTPPSTDTFEAPAAAAGLDGFRMVLLGLAVLLAMALLVQPRESTSRK
jgi:ribosome-associated protein YbcJ (S4-like RNA binding protein)